MLNRPERDVGMLSLAGFFFGFVLITLGFVFCWLGWLRAARALHRAAQWCVK